MAQNPQQGENGQHSSVNTDNGKTSGAGANAGSGQGDTARVAAAKADASDKRQEVSSNLRELLDSADELLRSTASYGGAEIEAARGKLKNQLELARIQASDYRQTLKETYQTASQAADECVHEHAWKAVCIAGVIGLLLGKCLSSDSRR